MKFLTLNQQNEVRVGKLKKGYCGFCGEKDKPVIVKNSESICEDCIQQLSEIIK